ncbi:MAG: hypothetical protein D6731_02690 [Planctomycetota bacterium]|nr:MAG: hypothetical protein D6731_02690 [Planctomycetota bacterium]
MDRPPLSLTLALAWSCALPCARGAPEVASLEGTGKPELLWDWERYRDPSSGGHTGDPHADNTFDGPVRFFRDRRGALYALASHAVSYRIPLRYDFRPKRRLNRSDVLFDSGRTYRVGGRLHHQGYGGGYLSGSAVESHYDNRLWIFSLWSEDGLHYGALAHHEFYPGLVPWWSNRVWINAVHHLRSDDGGRSFLPAPLDPTASSNSRRLVLVPRPSTPSLRDGFVWGFFHPSNLAREGDYWYALTMVSNWLGSTRPNGKGGRNGIHEQGFAMIRTRNPLSPLGWEGLTPRGWERIDHNTFQGRGGQPLRIFHRQVLDPFRESPRGGQLLTFGLVRHEPTGRWICLGYAAGGPTGLAFSTSPSLNAPSWSSPKPIRGVPKLPPHSYPTLYDPDAPGLAPYTVGDRPYLVFVHSNYPNDAYPQRPSPVPPVGLPVTDRNSRSIWRLPLRVVARGGDGALRAAAAPGFSGRQGAKGWSYLDGAGRPLAFDAGREEWSAGPGGPALWARGGRPGPRSAARRRFRVPRSGRALVSWTQQKHSARGPGVELRVERRGRVLYREVLRSQRLARRSLSLSVRAGEFLDFVIAPGPGGNEGDEVTFAPRVVVGARTVARAPSPPPPARPAPAPPRPAPQVLRFDARADFGSTPRRGWSYLSSRGPMRFSRGFYRGLQPYALLGAGLAHPGASEAVIRRWTAPRSGRLRIESFFRVPDRRSDGVVVTLRSGAHDLARYALPGGTGRRVDLTLKVRRGQTLDFVVERGPRSNHYDSTDCSIRLTLQTSAP